MVLRLPLGTFLGACMALAMVMGCSGGERAPALGEADRPAVVPAPSAAASLPKTTVTIHAGQNIGPLETWRQALGHGGINPLPLPPRVVEGVARLRPRLIRIFIQEFFFVYPEHGTYDWSRLDPYMDALARTGAKVVAAITIKPRPLYPTIDPRVWRPNDVREWQRLIAAMVQRYSVDKRIVTHWEIGNETDIGENGGCPYLIPDPLEYAEYYRMTIEPILQTFPGAKVGGPAVANAGSDYIERFVKACADQKLPLHFVSWHLYSDAPEQHAGLVDKYRKILAGYPGPRPEMLVTEWSKGFDPISIEELAYEPRRAAITAATLIAFVNAQVDWTFYYHIQDQVAYWDDFARFFQNPRIMYTHWNEIPHRFGLFGVGQEARPQYFVYQMLSRLGEQRLKCEWDQKDLHILAGRSPGAVNLMLVNYGRPSSQDRLATLRFAGLSPGRKVLRTWRIDRSLAWSVGRMELLGLENREIDVRAEYSCQVYCPADSVALVVIEDAR